MKKGKSTCLLWSSKCKFPLLAPSIEQLLQLVLVLCSYRVIETWFQTNQLAYLLWIIFQMYMHGIHVLRTFHMYKLCTNIWWMFCFLFCFFFFFKYNYQKLSGTYHHFFRNQDDRSGDQNLHIRCKEHMYINYSRPG